MKKIKAFTAAVLSAAMCFLLCACDQPADGGTDPTGDPSQTSPGETLSAPTDFTFDPVTGEYSFNATDPNAGYYFIRVYPVEESGEEAIDYAASSSRIPGGSTGTMTGTVELPSMGWGTFRAKLITFAASGSGYETPEAVTLMAEYGVGLTLERPEMLVMASGSQVELVMDWFTLSDYYDYEYMPEMKFTFYSDAACTNEVYSETVDLEELTATVYSHPMGYSWGHSYSEPSLHYYEANGELTGFGPYVGSQTYCFINNIYTYTLDPGTYYVTCQAISKLEYTNDSQPSTPVEFTLTEGEPTEDFTVGTTELWTDPPMSDIPSARSGARTDRVDFCGDQPIAAEIIDG